MPVQQNTSEAPSFFATQYQNPDSDDLISGQIDPTQPQVVGLTSYTDPLVVDHTLAVRMQNFDPALFNLSPASHLVRLLSALVGVGGIGGMRRQQTINRMSAAMSGTHFLDLDGFWGAIFGASRMSDEVLPQLDGEPINPATKVADTETWDAARSRDGKFRSRIIQLAAGFAQGATLFGVRMAAEAVLGCEVDLTESWVLVDLMPGAAHPADVLGNTYFALQSQYHTWGVMTGTKYANLEGGYAAIGFNTPLGNRGEVVLTPKRAVTDEERVHVANVLTDLAPAGMVVTVAATPVVAHREVAPRFVYADSSDWSVSSSITAYQAIADYADTIYPTVDGSQVASRPAFGEYSGESWSYNTRVSAVTAYQMTNNQVSAPGVDAQTVMFSDGTAQEFSPRLALLDPKQAAMARAGAEGILTSYPYAPGRFG
jgi:hypothetical protein